MTVSEDRHEGVQRKVWMPESMNQAVEKLAASTGQPISATLRNLIAGGLAKDADLSNITAMVEALLQPVMSRLDHMERLLFFIAQNTAFSVAATEDGARAQARRNHPDDAEAAAQSFDSAIGKLQGLTHERIRKALKGPRPTTEEWQEGMNDGTG